jgi:hypothetical protein
MQNSAETLFVGGLNSWWRNDTYGGYSNTVWNDGNTKKICLSLENVKL